MHLCTHASPELQEKLCGPRVTEQLTAHSCSVRLVLCAMTHVPAEGNKQQPSASKKSRSFASSCLLPMLHIDEEGAGLHIKKTIADYAGVPHGASMAAVRCAAGHLELELEG